MVSDYSQCTDFGQFSTGGNPPILNPVDGGSFPPKLPPLLFPQISISLS